MGLPEDYQTIINAQAADRRVRFWLKMLAAASLLTLITGACAFWGLL